ncbi:MAG: hypothetical protein HDS84_08895 [Bacteroidales bacterium]|nr:hypothetical protein [Bacteroidales bacterium]
MKTNQSYFWLNTRKYLVEHQKTILIFSCVYIGFCIISGIWTALLGATPGSASEGVYSFFAGLLCAVAASLTFNELSTKEGRISFLMTPGTTLDKYLPRVLTTVVGTTLLAIVGVYVLRGSQILTSGLAYQIWLPWDTGAITVNEEGLAEGIGILVSLYLFNEALFVLGSAIWPKKSFLKTMCVFIILQMVISLIGFIAAKNITIGYSISPSEVLYIARTVIAFIFIVDAFLFFWAYKRIEHKQVV